MNEQGLLTKELFIAIAKAINGQPTSAIIPALISASACALVGNSNDDLAMLEKSYVRFCELVQDEMRNMFDSDILAVAEEARQATKQ